MGELQSSLFFLVIYCGSRLSDDGTYSFVCDLAVAVPKISSGVKYCKPSATPQNFTFAYLASNVRESASFMNAVYLWNSRARFVSAAAFVYNDFALVPLGRFLACLAHF